MLSHLLGAPRACVKGIMNVQIAIPAEIVQAFSASVISAISVCWNFEVQLTDNVQ